MDEMNDLLERLARQAVADARDPSQIFDDFERILALDPSALDGVERVAARIALEILCCRARRAQRLLRFVFDQEVA